jgi:flagellar M-ring protein FliF
LPDFFKTVGAARFGVMAGVAAVLTAFFLYIAGAITEPPKSILFSGLESRDVSGHRQAGQHGRQNVNMTAVAPCWCWSTKSPLRMALAQDNPPAVVSAMRSSTSRTPSGTTAFVSHQPPARLEGERRAHADHEGNQSARCIWSFLNASLCPRRPAAQRIGRGEKRRQDGPRPSARHSALWRGGLPTLPTGSPLSTTAAACWPAATGNPARRIGPVPDEDRHHEIPCASASTIVSSVVGAGYVQVQVTADINYNHTQTTSETHVRQQGGAFPRRPTECLRHHRRGGSNAVSVALPRPAARAADRPHRQSRTSGRTGKNHQLRNLQEGHHLRRWR